MEFCRLKGNDPALAVDTLSELLPAVESDEQLLSLGSLEDLFGDRDLFDSSDLDSFESMSETQRAIAEFQRFAAQFRAFAAAAVGGDCTCRARPLIDANLFE